MKPPGGAKRANDNGTPEDHLVSVTLGLHRTLSGLAAPAEVLAAVLPPEAPIASPKPRGMSPQGDFGLAEEQAGDNQPG